VVGIAAAAAFGLSPLFGVCAKGECRGHVRGSVVRDGWPQRKSRDPKIAATCGGADALRAARSK